MAAPCENLTVKVFLPNFCLNVKSGILFGLEVEEDVLIILGSVNTESGLNLLSQHWPFYGSTRVSRANNLRNFCFAGIIASDTSLEQPPLEYITSSRCHSRYWLRINRTNRSTHELSQCTLFVKKPTDNGRDDWPFLGRSRMTDCIGDGGSPVECLVFLYGVNCIQSHTIQSRDTSTGNSITVLNRAFEQITLLQITSRNTIKANKDIKYVLQCNNNNRLLTGIYSFFYSMMLTTFHLVVFVGTKIFQNRLFINVVVQWCLKQSATVNQLREKFMQVQSILQLSRSDSQQAKRDQRLTNIKWKNLVGILLLDIMLGLLAFTVLSVENLAPKLAKGLSLVANDIGKELQILLDWLMGAPAGLKLNHPLTAFLGRFFLYHVHLWIAYMNSLQSIIVTLIWGMCLSSCLGVSFILAFAADTLSLLTIHVYCFYVYAARLYSFQLSGITALWRLFLGKKWNVLRQRVDSCSYDIDQLFLGTLLFTILLFLLPTTALYYMVFTAIRLVVLLIQVGIKQIISTLNRLPIFITLVLFVAPHRLPGHIYFSPIFTKDNKLAYLLAKKEPVPFKEIEESDFYEVEKESKLKNDKDNDNSWSILGQSLLWGRLIYPWKKPNE